MRPQAINAAMLGITMPERKDPNFWIPTRADDEVVIDSLLFYFLCVLLGEHSGRHISGVSCISRRENSLGKFARFGKREARNFGSHVGEGSG
ncbi:unannotated protein [freshwater metagenome]|uniref:Unannotated protein n=1 Tax=freshwater metagenome TaxID=449393 RepID=A0A6J7CIQ0_9ZZZZ